MGSMNFPSSRDSFISAMSCARERLLVHTALAHDPLAVELRGFFASHAVRGRRRRRQFLDLDLAELDDRFAPP